MTLTRAEQTALSHGCRANKGTPRVTILNPGRHWRHVYACGCEYEFHWTGGRINRTNQWLCPAATEATL